MQKQVGFIVIGDEILSGRTQDVNVQVLATRLAGIGARLAEVRMVPDDADVIVATIREMVERYDYAFSSGGIGPTHDDITADCVGQAFGVAVDICEDARAILATNYKGGEADLTDARLRMARIPEGAALIANPISKAPGFRIENLFVCAGVPEIFEVMLDDAVPQIEEGERTLSQSLILNLPESKIASPLAHVANEFPHLSIGCYPQHEDGRFWSEIVVKGFDEHEIDAAMAQIRAIG